MITTQLSSPAHQAGARARLDNLQAVISGIQSPKSGSDCLLGISMHWMLKLVQASAWSLHAKLVACLEHVFNFYDAHIKHVNRPLAYKGQSLHAVALSGQEHKCKGKNGRFWSFA